MQIAERTTNARFLMLQWPAPSPPMRSERVQRLPAVLLMEARERGYDAVRFKSADDSQKGGSDAQAVVLDSVTLRDVDHAKFSAKDLERNGMVRSLAGAAILQLLMPPGDQED